MLYIENREGQKHHHLSQILSLC